MSFIETASPELSQDATSRPHDATMSGSTSVVRAEKMALDGNNESQDSQQVLDAYMKIYGIGLVSVRCLLRPAQGSWKLGAVPRPMC